MDFFDNGICDYKEELVVEQPNQVTEEIISDEALSDSKNKEICNDLLAYFDWCYDNGISLDDCVDNAHEKVLRLYDITNEQLSEVTKSC